MNEFELIERYFARVAPLSGAVVGIGDDCAVIRIAPGHEIALSTDMLVEGRHFIAGADPERLGHKALAVNLSDCAANGAVPRYALLAMALPDASEHWLAGFSRGLFALADRFDVELIGGDTTRGPLNLCVTIVGEVPSGSSLLRSGARAGDTIWVSGRLGSAAIGLALLQGTVSSTADVISPDTTRGKMRGEMRGPVASVAGASRADWLLSPEDRRRAIDALEMPEPRVELGVALRGIATAAIDVSDGLAGDLTHIIERSRVGAELFVDAIPCEPWLRAMRDGALSRMAISALLAGGDDYELCFTAAASSERAVLEAGRDAGVDVTAIGRIVEGHSLRVINADGKVTPMDDVRAFDHFR